VTSVTWGIRALVVLAAAVLVATSSAAQARNFRRVVFVTLQGHGHVTSSPAGLSCPSTCRGFFLKDQHVRLVAHAAPGWRLVRWSGSCSGKKAACGFFVADSHDCANGTCPIGAFGVRVTFSRLDGSS
jgi:hypothetical protein